MNKLSLSARWHRFLRNSELNGYPKMQCYRWVVLASHQVTKEGCFICMSNAIGWASK